MIPLVETASSTPLGPKGLKPFAAEKLEPWNELTARTMIVNSGTATFHQVAALLAVASLRTPRKLIEVNTAINPIATRMPVPVRTCSPPDSFCQPWAQE